MNIMAWNSPALTSLFCHLPKPPVLLFCSSSLPFLYLTSSCFLQPSRTCCTQSFRTGRLWRPIHSTKSETMLSSRRVSFKSCCSERSTEPPPQPHPPKNLKQPLLLPYTFWPPTFLQKMEVAHTANRFPFQNLPPSPKEKKQKKTLS